MANKQTTPNTKLDGANFKQKISLTPYATNLKRIVADDPFDIVAGSAIEASKKLLNRKKQTDFKNYAMNTDFALSSYRDNLSNASSFAQIEQIEENGLIALEEGIKSKEFGDDFWKEHGKNLTNINNEDINNIKAEKTLEFGRNSLISLLQDSQNWLTKADSDKADILLTQGLEEIAENPFIEDKERDIYKNEFLDVGILNIALKNPDDALMYLDKYNSDNYESINNKILEIKNIKENNKINLEKENKIKEDFASINNAQSLWQNMERKNISAEQYYVLSKDMDDDKLIKYNVADKDSVLNAYNIIKRINYGEGLTPTDIKQVNNHLANAYYQKKLGLEEVTELQDRLLLAQMPQSSAELMFDKEIDELADRVLFKDISNVNDDVKKMLMDSKAGFSLDLYQDYYDRKVAIAQGYKDNGIKISSSLEKKIRRQALAETKQELGLMENDIEALSYADFNIYLKNNYSGDEKENIWRNFVKLSPYKEDKMSVFKQVVARQKLKEEGYPNFEAIDEATIAGLEAGDRYYLNGKLQTYGKEQVVAKLEDIQDESSDLDV